MNPFFSIIIPVFNSEKTIKETLNSVLNQSYKDYEVIIINDFSTDNSLTEINKFKNKFFNFVVINNNRNLGVAESRNKGFSISTGNYIALLDSDDIWMNDKLEQQKHTIELTNCDICCSSYNFIDEYSRKIKKTYIVPKCIDYEMMLKQNYIGCSTAIVRRELLLNNFMDSSYQHEDYALWLKLIRDGAVVKGITEPLMKYRIFRQGRSYNKAKAAKGRMTIYLNQEKLGLINSLYYFSCYALGGIKKKLL